MAGLRMRPYDPRRDLFALLAAYADPAEQAQFAVRAPVGDMRAFDAWLTAQLRGSYQDFCVAEDAATGEFAGFAHSYDVRLADGHCKICTYVTPPYRAAGAGGWLAAAFMGELFALYPLRKIYAAVYAYNAASLASCTSAGFEEECRLREFRYFDGAYHDCVLLSLTRERYGERVAPLVAGLAGVAEKDGADGVARGGGACAVLRQSSPPSAAAELRAAAGTAAPCAWEVAGLVLDVLGEMCGRVPELEEALADDLGFDSFDMLSLTVRLEDALCCEIDERAMAGVHTVGDVCAAARSAREGRAGA